MIAANTMGEPQKPTASDQQLVTLGRILQALREEENVDVLIETTLSYLKDEFDYSAIWLGLYDRLDHRLFGKGGITPTGDTTFLKQRFFLTPGDLLEQVVIQQRPVGVANLQAEPRAGELRSFAHTFNIQGTILFPIRHKDRCFGVVLLGTSQWGVSPRPEEKARLSMLLGELASVLYQIEIDWHHTQTKRPDQTLFRLLEKLQAVQTFEQRLEAVVEETHQFVDPSRTNIYWFERERRYFWRRIGNRLSQTGMGDHQSSAGITVQEVNDFYQALAENKIIAVGEARSSLKAGLTSRLMQRIRARSLLAAPILVEDELLGFLSVEGTEPRIWAEEEKNYLRGAAQLIALIAPLETMEMKIQQIQLDTQLTAQIAHAIHNDEDWKETLRNCSQQLLNRLEADRFLVLQYDEDSNQFEACYQSQPGNRRALSTPLSPLSELDWQLLLQCQGNAVAIENVEVDLRLVTWRQTLLDLGVRSLLVCNTSIGHRPESLLVIGHETTRSWTAHERDLLRVVSQQLGLILRQWQLHTHTEKQQKILQAIQWSLTSAQQPQSYEQLEQFTLQHIAAVTNCPLAVLLTWWPGEQMATGISSVTNSRFAVYPDINVSVQTEALIQWSLSAAGVLPLSVDDLPASSKQWLSGPGIGQLLVMALHTAAEHQPTGMVLVADHRGRHWSEECLDTFTTLVRQLAWSRRHLKLSETMQSETEALKQLNWYKHRRLEEMQRAISYTIEQLSELSFLKDALTNMRYQQLLRQLSNTSASMNQLLKEEQWRLYIASELVPIATVLKRSLERVDKLMQQRKLWSGVHGMGTADSGRVREMSISGDIGKIELVLYELLVAACHRSEPGGRIDIWCRPTPVDTASESESGGGSTGLLEVAITDSGTIEPQLLADLQATGKPKDELAPSTLNQLPGLHLAICQKVMQQIGGELNFYRLEDGRLMSRLLLPLP